MKKDAPLAVADFDIDAARAKVGNWGRWGPDDELGTLNLITPQARARAAALVREGEVVSLGRRMHLGVSPHIRQSAQWVYRRPPPESCCGNACEGAMEYVGMVFHGYAVTHLDALNHVHYGDKMYNGFSVDEFTATGSEHLTVERMHKHLSGRGVLVDMPRANGVEYLAAGYAVTPEDIERALAAQAVKPEAGDILFVRTGKLYDNGEQGTPGMHGAVALWLHKHDIAALGTDVASDVTPSDVPIHRLCITMMGMPLIDNCDLGPLAETCARLGRYTFFVAIAPARAVGATGWPVNPLAMF